MKKKKRKEKKKAALPIGHIDFKGGSPSSFGTKCISEDASNASMTERIISVWCENEKKKKKKVKPHRESLWRPNRILNYKVQLSRATMPAIVHQRFHLGFSEALPNKMKC